jgi:hypothetical protein
MADGSWEGLVAGFVGLLYAFCPATFFTRNMSGVDEAPTSPFANLFPRLFPSLFPRLFPSLFGFDFGYGVNFGVHVRTG